MAPLDLQTHHPILCLPCHRHVCTCDTRLLHVHMSSYEEHHIGLRTCSAPEQGSPGGASSEGPAFRCRRRKRLGFNPRSRKWQPTPGFLPGGFPRTEEPGGLQSMGSHTAAHDWLCAHTAQDDLVLTASAGCFQARPHAGILGVRRRHSPLRCSASA